jgi:hypothetical protein
MATTNKLTDGLTADMCLALHILVTEGTTGFNGDLYVSARDLESNELVTEDGGEFTVTDAGHAAYTPAVARVALAMLAKAEIANEGRP